MENREIKSQEYNKFWKAMEGIIPEVADRVHKEVKDLVQRSYGEGFEKGKQEVMKKIPEGCIEIPLSEVSYIYQSPFSHNPTVVMKTHEKVTSIRRKEGVLEDGQITSAVDEEGLAHIFILKEIKP